MSTNYNHQIHREGPCLPHIITRYTEKGRVYHTLEHVYQMVLNYRQYYDKMTYPRNVMFAIFFHDIIYDPQVSF